MYFTYQETRIWEGGDHTPDPSRKPIRIKARSEDRAKKKLPPPGLGRDWVLIPNKEAS